MSIIKAIKNKVLKFISYKQAENIKNLLAIFLYYSGVAYFFHFSRKRGTFIIVFHSIADRKVFSDNCLHPLFFEKVIKYLSQRYEIVHLSKLIRYLQTGKAIPSNWIVLTFDDGYKDNLNTALPILRQYNAMATFYITLDVLKRKKVFFYDSIQLILDNTPLKQIDIRIDGIRYSFTLSDYEQKIDAALRIVLAIRNKIQDEQEKIVLKLSKICSKEDFNPQELSSYYLEENDVIELHKYGMEIGSHSLSHPDLTILKLKELQKELFESKKQLENIIGENITAFSYPYGKQNTYNEFIKTNIKMAGYSSAVSTRFGVVTKDTNQYELPRIGVRGLQLTRLKVNLMGIPI